MSTSSNAMASSAYARDCVTLALQALNEVC